MDRVPLIVNQRSKGTMRTQIERLSRRFSRLFTLRELEDQTGPFEPPMELSENPTIEDWCRFPRLTCVCPTTYEVLDEKPDDTEESTNEESTSKDSPSKPSTSKESPNKKSAKKSKKSAKSQKPLVLYPFYTVHNVIHDVGLEEKLNAAYVTRLLTILELREVDELQLAHHRIVEEWDNLGAERVLEDHEYVLPAWNCIKAYRRHKRDAIFRFRYRRERTTKHDIFVNPMSYLDKHYLYPHALDPSQEIDVEALKSSMMDDNWSPTLYSHGYYQDRDHDMKYFLVLKFNSVYSFEDQDTALRFLKATEHLSLEDQAWDLQEIELVHKFDVVVRLQNYHVYKLVKRTSQLRSLNSIILRPVILENPNDKFPETVLSFDTDKERSCWLSAMRLAKYGKQLRANYKAFRNKRPDTAAAPFAGRSVDSMVPSGSEESKVAMDFTGPVSRVVEDPEEARLIAMNEGYSWKQRYRLITRGCCNVSTNVGLHLFQTWYHGPMPREVANYFLGEAHISDGTFLVRESMSGSRAGQVISYRYGNKVIHRPIHWMIDPQTKNIVLSIDYGATRFFDVTSLIEFYQLNRGCLPCRLLKHLIKEPVKKEESEKASEQAPEKASEQAPEKASEQAPEKASEQAPEKASEQAPEKASEQAPEKASEQAPEKASEQAPMEAPEQAPMEVAEQAPMEVVEQAPEKP